MLEFLLHALNQDSMEIQAVAAIGIAKLMLSGMVADNEVRPLRQPGGILPSASRT